MIQFGQNAGARHLRVYGLVNNLRRKSLTNEEREVKNCRILGVFALSWAIFQSSMPKEITDACDEAIQHSEMDSMTHIADTDGVLNYDNGWQIN